MHTHTHIYNSQYYTKNGKTERTSEIWNKTRAPTLSPQNSTARAVKQEKNEKIQQQNKSNL